MKLVLSKASATRKEVLTLTRSDSIYEKVSETGDEAQIDFLCEMIQRIVKEDKDDIN